MDEKKKECTQFLQRKAMQTRIRKEKNMAENTSGKLQKGPKL